MDDLARSGAAVAAVIQAEIDAGISAENIYFGGYSQGGRVLWHTAFAQLNVALGGYFAINTIPQYPMLLENVQLDSP